MPLITPVTVKGKGPYLFLIDPDANLSVIDQQVVTEADDVCRRAVVLGAHPLGRDQLRLGGAEQRLAGSVERVGAARQLLPTGGQPRAQHLVVAAGQGSIVARSIVRPAMIVAAPTWSSTRLKAGG